MLFSVGPTDKIVIPLIESENIHGYNEVGSHHRKISVTNFKDANNEGYIFAFDDFWLTVVGSVGRKYSWFSSSDQSVKIRIVRRVSQKGK